MINRIIFDTSFLVALIDKKDNFHQRAKEIYLKIEELNIEIFIFDCVVSETLNVFSRRCNEQKRKTEFENLLNKVLLLIKKISITWTYDKIKELYEDIIKEIKNTKGELNFNDILIVLSAKRFAIPCIISFDSDFDKLKEIKRVARKEDLIIEK